MIAADMLRSRPRRPICVLIFLLLVLLLCLFRAWTAISLNKSAHRLILYDMAALPQLRFLTVNARTKHTATVIFIHVGCVSGDRGTGLLTRRITGTWRFGSWMETSCRHVQS